MFKKSKNKRIIILVCLVLVGVALLWLGLPKIQYYLAGSNNTINRSTTSFFIDRPLTPEELATLLEKEHIIDDRAAFLRVAHNKKLNKDRIALGKYSVASSTSYRSLLNGFIKNKSGNGNAEKEVTVAFNNCHTIYQMAGKVSQSLMLDSAQLVQYLMAGNTLQKYGLTLEQLPAMFIPNSYKFFYDTDAKTFTARMAEEFREFWSNKNREKMTKLGLKSPSEVATLASIVYAEQSRNADEWPIIAGLYLNRIRQGMKLQSDPTFKFCWGNQLDGVQRLLAVHRNIVCSYNTYQIKGLPPGPINLPNKKVLEAVLNAPNVDFLYMCAKPDYSGRHNFAVTGAEHMKNAKIFQDWLSKEQQKKQH